MSEFELTRFLLALAALVSAAQMTGYLFERLHLPRVGGEICGGMLLGYSLLGWLSPEITQWVFYAFPQQQKAMAAFYWLGMVLLMFASGLRIEQTVSKDESRTILVIVLGTGVAFLLGWVYCRVSGIAEHAIGGVQPLAFELIIATAVSVTSIPVLSKIFIDLGVTKTRFATVVLGAATLQDIFLWTAVAFATSLERTGSADPAMLLRSVGLVAAFVLAAGLLGLGSFRLLNTVGGSVLLRASPIGYLLVICFVFVALACLLEVNAMFGALIAGVLAGKLPDSTFGRVKEEVSRFSLGFFVPLYFALVGFRINLPQEFDFGLTLSFLFWSSLIKITVVLLASRITGKDWLTCTNLAIAVNCRGGPGIVLASLAYELHLIDASLFVAMIITSLMTAMISGTWLRAVLSRSLPLYGSTGGTVVPVPPLEADETRPAK